MYRYILLMIVFLLCLPVSAQRPSVVRIGPDGKPMVMPTAPSTASPSSASKQETPKGAEEAKSDKKDGAKEAEKPPEPKVIRRDEKTTGDKSDPDELKATVGDDGKVAFHFRNQPWVDLVQWLADISDQPLDWQELPGDRVNLRSPGRYTVEETRDLFNRYLLARGYTLLEIDGGITVAKTASINPAIVPRVDEAMLASLSPHTFVRASLDVGWLSAEKLAVELKPMVSANGTLTALTTTNRIEAMDAAVNLQQVAELLREERNSASQEALAPEFKLRYLPAEEAKRMLEEFLGVKKEAPAPMTPQQIQMMQQMRQQNKGAAPAEKKVEISIVANVRQNSVIIRAPADRVAVATQFLNRVDVPGDAMVNLSDVESRVEVFRLASLDPEKLIEIVSEMNILEPTTRIRVDKDNNALIVSGSGADRYIIKSIIERLDGTGRTFRVLQLRRLDANEVAESISFLMGQKDDDDKQSSRSRYSYYGYGYGRNEEQDKEKDEFRVAANNRYRQVLLWADDREMQKVESLLVELGELPPPGGSSRTIRVIDASATPETYEYLQRLRQQWNRISPNPLELPDADQFEKPNRLKGADEEGEASEKEEESEQKKPDANEKPAPGKETKPAGDTIAQADDPLGYQLTAMQSPELTDRGTASDPPKVNSARDFDRVFGTPTRPEPNRTSGPPAEVRIALDEDGNLVLISPDTKALDELERLMLQVAPPKRPYRVFAIEHASAFWMRLNLEDYFADDEDSDDSDSDSFFRWYYGADDQSDDEPSGLSKNKKLRFVDDPDTNTLVVTGASSEQLRTIGELIELWDVPEPVNKRKARFTKLVQVKYGHADKIAETVKEAYRDLLSSNDKTFRSGQPGQNGGGGGQKQEATKSRDGNGSGLVDSESGREGGGTDFSFKGKLSLGVDEIGNALLVSAEGESLLDLVCDMINQLDEAARPQGEVQVVELSGEISGEALEQALRALGAGAITSSRGNARESRPAVKPDGE